MFFYPLQTFGSGGNQNMHPEMTKAHTLKWSLLSGQCVEEDKGLEDMPY
jgi:hypothetical protein